MSVACAWVAGTVNFLANIADAEPEKLARADYVVDAASLGALDPFARLTRVASGDVQAMRDMADAILLWVLSKNDPTPLATMREGLIMARMAASQGGAGDILRLIYMLAYAGIICPADELDLFAPEMIALVEIMADRGHEDCATLLASVAEHETAETLAGAQEMKARIVKAWGLE